MNYAQARDIAVAAIPVIDMAALYDGRADGARRVARELRHAAETVGFFYVRNHGVPQELMARWTNGRFKSTPHRVVNRSGRERLSIATFVDPNYEMLVEPMCADGATPLYAPVACGDYIVSRYDTSFAYRNKMDDRPDGAPGP